METQTKEPNGDNQEYCTRICVLPVLVSLEDSALSASVDVSSGEPQVKLPIQEPVQVSVAQVSPSSRSDEETKEPESIAVIETRSSTNADVEADDESSSSSELRPDFDLLRPHLEQFMSIQGEIYSTRRIQKFLSWAPHPLSTSTPLVEWDWVRSLTQQLVSLGRFVETLPRDQISKSSALRLFESVITKAFEMIVPGVTQSPVMLARTC